MRRTPESRSRGWRRTGARAAVSLSALGTLAATTGCGQGGSHGPPRYTRAELLDPQSCRPCHEQYYRDWSASMHAYASDDPLFVAMNQRGQDTAQVGPFCVQCHAPVALRTGQTSDGTNLASLPQYLKGVTCYFCHNVDGLRASHGDGGLIDAEALSPDGGGIDDDALHFVDDGVMRAAIADPLANAAHDSTYSSFHDGTRLQSSQLCGGCHDVVNGHGAHIERTFAEWSQTLYNSTGGGNACNACHMHKSTGLVATTTGAGQRTVHDHKFPGVDLPLIALPSADPASVDAHKQAVQDFLNTELATALCVRGVPSTGASIFLVVDNVAAGHSWPSGASQDRRAWFHVVASAGGAKIYESGLVQAGHEPTVDADPDMWLLRDCMLDGQGNVVHNFWDALSSDSNELPGPVTLDMLDRRFYQTHVIQTYPRGPTAMLPSYPDEVTLDVNLLAFPLDLYDDLFSDAAGLPLTDAGIADMRAKLLPLPVGPTLTWTPAAASDSAHGGSFYFDQGIPVYCVSNSALNTVDHVPATVHASPSCRP